MLIRITASGLLIGQKVFQILSEKFRLSQSNRMRAAVIRHNLAM